MKNTVNTLSLIVGSALVLAGCATSPYGTHNNSTETKAPPPVSSSNDQPPAPPATASLPPQVTVKPVEAPQEPSASTKNLAAALSAFERGEYASAIRQLTPLGSDPGLDTASQVRALKTLAFSQCLSRATVACRQTFERAFRVDSKFDLAPAERGHPSWGPQFERARKTVLGAKGS